MTTTTRTPALDLEAISARLRMTAHLVNMSAARVLEPGEQDEAIEGLLLAIDRLRQVHEVLTTK